MAAKKKISKPRRPIFKIENKIVKIYKAQVSPNITSKKVIATDPWNYVDLWLRREKQKESLFYWEQAHNFHKASEYLDNLSKPLTLYPLGQVKMSA